MNECATSSGHWSPVSMMIIITGQEDDEERRKISRVRFYYYFTYFNLPTTVQLHGHHKRIGWWVLSGLMMMVAWKQERQSLGHFTPSCQGQQTIIRQPSPQTTAATARHKKDNIPAMNQNQFPILQWFFYCYGSGPSPLLNRFAEFTRVVIIS